MKATEEVTDRKQGMNITIANGVMMALIMASVLSAGYLVGYLHATSMPENAEPGFVLGFAMASAFAVPTIYMLKNGVPDRLKKVINYNSER